MRRILALAALASLSLAGLAAAQTPPAPTPPAPEARPDAPPDSPRHMRGHMRGHGHMHPPMSRAARFHVTRGDMTLNVRCAENEPMRACVDAATALMDKVAPQPAR